MKCYRKYLIIIALLAALSLTAFPAFGQPAAASPFSGGNGSANDPYIIASASELAAVNSPSYLNNTYFALGCDINLTESLSQSTSGWLPIGSKDTPFNGSFDGMGYTVSGLWIESTKDYAGLFSVVGEKGTVKNLNLIIDNSAGKSVTGSSYIGALAGSLSGSISNCHVTAVNPDITAVCAKTNAAGGLVGRMLCASVTNSSAAVSVSAQAYAGGLVGYQQSNNASNTCTIKNSFAQGSVKTEVAPFRAGGLVGAMQDNCSVINSYATGAVSRSSGSGGDLGGIAGSCTNVNANAFTDCFFNTETTGLQNGVGSGARQGIYAKNSDEMKLASTFANWDFKTVWLLDNGMNAPLLVQTAFSGGDGSADSPFIITSADQLDLLREYTGPAFKNTFFKLGCDIELAPYLSSGGNGFQKWGASGWLPVGTLENAFYAAFDGAGHTIKDLFINRESDSYLGLFGFVAESGSVRALTVKISDSGAVAGANYVGGIAGCLQGTVERCAVIQIERPSGFGISAASSFAGGIAGCIDNGAVRNSYSKVNVSGENAGGIAGYMAGENAAIRDCRSSGNITASKSAGYASGIVGLAYGGSVSSCFSGAFVSGSRNAGPVAGSNASAEILNSYYDASISQDISGNGAVNAAALSNTESFPGLDFTYTWIINGYGAPHLRWEAVLDRGSGTVSDPYIIMNAEQLAYISNYLGEKYINTCFKLGADIDLYSVLKNNESGWQPIGDPTLYFQGKFDGSGYTISGLRINRPDSAYVGLFGYLGSMSDISNLNVVVDNSSLNGGIRGKNNVGAIAGFHSGRLLNCFVSAAVNENDAVIAQSNAGGLTGYIGGASARIEACGSSVNVAASDSTAGSLAGIAAYGAVVRECFATGDVTAASRAGGLIGWLYESSAADSYALGNVSAENGQAGGLIGHMQGASTALNCYAAGEVSSLFSAGGSIVGEAAKDAILTGCYYFTDIGLPVVGLSGDNTAAGDSKGLTFASAATMSNYLNLNKNKWALVEGKTLPYLYWQNSDISEYDYNVITLYAIEGSDTQSSSGRFNITRFGVAVFIEVQIVELPDECILDYSINDNNLSLKLNARYPYAELFYKVNDGNLQSLKFKDGTLDISLKDAEIEIVDLVAADSFGNTAKSVFPEYVSVSGAKYNKAPVISITVSPETIEGFWLGSATVDISCKTADGKLLDGSQNVRIECLKDGLAYSRFASGQVLTESGQYTITVTATDSEGNTATVKREVYIESAVAELINACGSISEATDLMTLFELKESHFDLLSDVVRDRIINSPASASYELLCSLIEQKCGGVYDIADAQAAIRAYKELNYEHKHALYDTACKNEAEHIELLEKAVCAYEWLSEDARLLVQANYIDNIESLKADYTLLMQNEGFINYTAWHENGGFQVELYGMNSLSLDENAEYSWLELNDVTGEQDSFTFSPKVSQSAAGNVSGCAVKPGESIVIKIALPVGFRSENTLIEPVADGRLIEYKLLNENGILYALVKTSDLSTVITVRLNEQQLSLEQPSNAAGFQNMSDAAGHWAEKAIEYVVDNALLSGTSETTFSPDIPMTRAMLVGLLYELEGANAEGAYEYNAFVDITSDNPYYDAVAWANNAGIVVGIGDGLFSPNSALTREQIAQILYRYATYKGDDVLISADLSHYADESIISSEAYDAVSWAVARGLIIGRSDNNLAPVEIATRAEVSMILFRF